MEGVRGLGEPSTRLGGGKLHWAGNNRVALTFNRCAVRVSREVTEAGSPSGTLATNVMMKPFTNLQARSWQTVVVDADGTLTLTYLPK